MQDADQLASPQSLRSPRPRPRTSHATLHSLFHPFTSDSTSALPHAASSVDLQRKPIDLHRATDNSWSAPQLPVQGSTQAQSASSTRIEQRVQAGFNKIRRRLSVAGGFRKHAAVGQGKPLDCQSIHSQSSATATLPQGTHHTQHHSLNHETGHPVIRRSILARDRHRRNAISFHPGQNITTSTDDLYELSRRQAPQQFCVEGGQGARAAVAATQEEARKKHSQKQSAMDKKDEIHRGLYQMESMDVDSAYGEESDEGVAMASNDKPPFSQPVRKDPTQFLPPEICLSIMEYLDMSSLTRAQRVSRTWLSFASTNRSWQSAYINRFGDARKPAYIQFGGKGLGRTSRDPQQNWHAMAKARTDLENNWRTSNGRAVYFQGHTDSVYCCQFDEDKIVTGSRDRTIRVWDIHTYKCLKVIGGPAAKPLLPVPNETPLETVTQTAWPGVNVNGTPEGDTIYHTPKDYHSASILCLQYDKEIMVTGSSDATCLVWDMKTYNPIARLKHHEAGVLDVCLDGTYVISCSKDHTICVWSRKTWKLVKVLRGHVGPVNAVQLRSNYLVSASGDGRCKLWDLRNLDSTSDAASDATRICIRTFQSGDRGLAAVEFSDDGSYILAGGNDQIIYKFDVRSGIVVDKYAGHTGLVRSLFLDYNNRRVLSGSYDQGIRVYNFDTTRTIGNYDNWTTSWILAAKSDYRRVVATSQDGRALMIDFGHGIDDAWLLGGEGKRTILEQAQDLIMLGSAA